MRLQYLLQLGSKCICTLYRHIILHVHVYTQDTQWYNKLLVVRSTTLHDINLGGGALDHASRAPPISVIYNYYINVGSQ